MAIFPCDNKGLCIDPANPFQNFSAEAPDQETFIGFDTGFGPSDFYPPLGSDFFAVGCRSFCVSDVSQKDADQCAARTNVDCLARVWPVATLGTDIFGNPTPLYRRRNTFLNREQSTTVTCPDGIPFTYTVPAGVYEAFSQEDADQAALSDAQENAPLFLICLSDLTVAQACPNVDYAASITASGMSLTDDTVCWTLIGSLPPGLESDLDESDNCETGSRTLNFFGTPTTPGNYTFTILVNDKFGNSMFKSFTIRIEGIMDVNPMPDGMVGTAYSQTLTAIGVTNPIYSLEAGTLPSGLSLDSTGVIFGTPTANGISTFTLGITEAGSGKTCLIPASLDITGTAHCGDVPTQTRTDALVGFSGVAFKAGDSLALVLDGSTPNLQLYDIKNNGFALQTSASPTDIAGGVVWSPAAGPLVLGVPQGEWVHFGTDGTQSQTNWRSFNRTTLGLTGTASGTNVAAGTWFVQPWGMCVSPTSGFVYGISNTTSLRVYNSVTHVAGLEINGFTDAIFVLGQISIDDPGNRLFIAGGGSFTLGIAVPSKLQVYNATTLALIHDWALPHDNVLPPAGNQFNVMGCLFNPDDGMVYVAANDTDADGGDVVYVVDPNTGTTIKTIRLLTGVWTVPNTLVNLATPIAYNPATHQIYILATILKAPAVNTLIQVICCDTRTKVTTIDLGASERWGDIKFADRHDTVPIQTVNEILSIAFSDPNLRGYTYP